MVVKTRQATRTSSSTVALPTVAEPLRFGSPSGDPRAAGWVLLVLLAIATNAVLIQTVVDEESNLKNLIRAGIVVLSVLTIATRRVVFPTWIVALVILSGTLYGMTGNSDQLTVIFVLLVTPTFWAISEKKLERAMMIASVFALLLVFAFLLMGLTTNELRTSQTYLSADVRERYTFGTNGVPFFMNLVYGSAAFVIFYVHRWRVQGRFLISLVALLVVAYLFVQTDGRGGAVAVIVFCALAIAMPTLSRLSFARWFLMLQPVIYLAATLWIASQHHNPVLNQALSFRPMLYGQFVGTVSFWDLWSSTSVKASADVTTVDSSMLHLLYGGGAILFIVFSLLFARATHRLLARKMYLHLAFLTATMIYGISESILMRVENIFILFAWYLVLRYALKEPSCTGLK